LIVYHSKTGGSRQMAEAAYSTACEEVTTILKTAEEAGPEDLLPSEPKRIPRRRSFVSPKTTRKCAK
jgi:hypothetical protein